MFFPSISNHFTSFCIWRILAMTGILSKAKSFFRINSIGVLISESKSEGLLWCILMLVCGKDFRTLRRAQCMLFCHDGNGRPGSSRLNREECQKPGIRKGRSGPRIPNSLQADILLHFVGTNCRKRPVLRVGPCSKELINRHSESETERANCALIRWLAPRAQRRWMT